MPRIPMSERGYVPHVENGVRMRGAPGMDFGMDTSRALRDAGNGLEDLGRGALELYAAGREFVEREADTQNKLAATNARNLYRAINEELENRMASNPADFKEYSKWADEADQRYLDEVRQYTEQMTTPFRNQFNAEMEGIRIDSLSQRRKIGIQAKVTADYNMMQTLLKDAAQRGDEAEYKRILDEHKGTLISEEEYNIRNVEYGKLADSAAAKRLVDAAADSESPVQAKSILERLKERDSDGNYVNFKNITEDYRDQLIRVAKTAKTQKETERDAHVLAEINQGRVPTEDSLIAAKDADIITEEQFNRYMGWVKSYNSAIASAEKAAKAEAKAEKNEAKQAANEAKRLQREQETIEKDHWNYKISNTWFSSDPNAAWAQREQIWSEILKSVNDSSDLNELMKHLDSQMQDGLSGKSEFTTPDGKLVQQYIEKSYRDGVQIKGLSYDPSGLFNKVKDQKFMQARYYEIHEMAREMLRKGKTGTEVIEEVKKRVGQLNDGEIKFIMTPRYIRDKAQTGFRPQPGDTFGGYIFKGGDPADERSWSKK